jgi:hypothetical protein
MEVGKKHGSTFLPNVHRFPNELLYLRFPKFRPDRNLQFQNFTFVLKSPTSQKAEQSFLSKDLYITSLLYQLITIYLRFITIAIYIQFSFF